MKPNLITLEVQPFCSCNTRNSSTAIARHTSQSPLSGWVWDLLSRYDEFLLDAKQWCLSPILSLERPEVAHSEIWCIWWLWDGLNLGLHKKLLHCEGCVTRHTVIVQIQLFLHCFFQECFQLIQMGWSFYLLPVTSSHTHLMSWLCNLWPNFCCSLTLLACHCTPNSLVILDCF